MRTLVIYDSLYGNTEKIAKAIGGAIGGDTQILHVDQAAPLNIDDFDLLIFGSPTHGGRPTPAIQDYINYIEPHILDSIQIAAFDTRLHNTFAKMFGFAADRIGDSFKLIEKALIVLPEGFIVTSKEGPLKQGELERAANWAKQVVKNLSLANTPVKSKDSRI